MAVAFGNNIKVNIYGASHNEKIGVTFDGLPAGLPVDMEKLQAFLDRRAPGRSEWSTSRKEPDVPEFISGVTDGKTDGSTLEAVIHNRDAKPEDYENTITVPRPGHADFTSWVKYGRIESGGGKWSGRMTAPLCIAGGLCMQFMETMGIKVAAHIYEIGGVYDEAGDSATAGELMKAKIADAKAAGDSIGGQVKCIVTGIPAGIGDALFGGMESRISQAVFAVPAVKSIEFGDTQMYGSDNNDSFAVADGDVVTKTNHHGGILGGISSGMPLVFKVKIKPTPSIEKEQDSIDLITKEPVKLSIHGRHDPCIVPRAVPCIEAAAAIAVYDMLLGE